MYCSSEWPEEWSKKIHFSLHIKWSQFNKHCLHVAIGLLPLLELFFSFAGQLQGFFNSVFSVETSLAYRNNSVLRLQFDPRGRNLPLKDLKEEDKGVRNAPMPRLGLFDLLCYPSYILEESAGRCAAWGARSLQNFKGWEESIDHSSSQM